MTTTTIQKWGNSLAVRLSRDTVKRLKLKQGETVRVVDEGRAGIRIVPAPARPETLKELVARITPENRHAELGWGAPRGVEVW